MSTWQERRINRLQQRIRSRTRSDGTPLPGFKQNVAQIRAEIEQLAVDNRDERENG